MSALISECGNYRYWLERNLNRNAAPSKLNTLVICMLNPSTADATVNDRTIETCMSFAMRWCFARIVVVNLYALRSTDPDGLWRVNDPVGPMNADYLKLMACYPTVLCAWGANAPLERQWEVAQIFKAAGAKMLCLGLTKNGSPRHPLYIKRTLLPLVYDVVKEPGRMVVTATPQEDKLWT